MNVLAILLTTEVVLRHPSAHRINAGISARSNTGMAIIVTDNCRRCRFTECVMVCPVACFHGDSEMVYIESGACIECRACIPVCPVHAIYDSEELPPEKQHWIAINVERAAILPIVDEKQSPLPTADAQRAKLGY